MSEPDCDHENTHVEGCLKCRDCGGVPELDVRAVPESELRELIEEWRNHANELERQNNQSQTGRGFAYGQRECANKLAAVLDE